MANAARKARSGSDLASSNVTSVTSTIRWSCAASQRGAMLVGRKVKPLRGGPLADLAPVCAWRSYSSAAIAKQLQSSLDRKTLLMKTGD